MPKPVLLISPFSLIKTALSILIRNPVIFYPLFLLACIQFLILEIIFFVPRPPLLSIFAPILNKSVAVDYLHYPLNFLLMYDWFHKVEIITIVLFGSMMYAALIVIVEHINQEKPIDMKEIFKKVRSSYVQIVLFFVLCIMILQGISFLYFNGVDFFLAQSNNPNALNTRQILINWAPLVQFFLSCLVAALFAFVLPVIAVEGKKLPEAIKINFKQYSRAIWVVFRTALCTGIIYLPFLFTTYGQIQYWAQRNPEWVGWYSILSITVMLLVDALQYTVIAVCYLIIKEEQA